MKKIVLLNIFLLITGTISGQDTTNLKYTYFYYNNGKISSEGFMKDGEPEGYWKSYYPEGTKKTEGNRRNHLLDSTWIFYSVFEDTTEKINYVMGKRNGFSFTYNSDRNDKPENIGKVIAKELYVNDKKEGIAYYFFNDGKIKKISNYKNNQLNGNVYEYDEDGIITSIVSYNKGIITDRERINRFDDNNLKTGVWKEFDNDLRVVKEIEYKNDTINGIYKEYNKNGDISLILKYDKGNLIEEDTLMNESIDIRNEYDNNGNLIYSGSFKNDIPVGIHRKYNENGDVINSFIYNNYGILLSEGIIDKDGKKEGNWKYFYNDGNVKSVGKYVSNLETGIWTYYYNNGNFEQKGEFRNGKYNGLWKWYFENKNIKKEENYFNGKEEGLSVEYNELGEVISKGEYFEGEMEGEWFYYVNDHKETGSYVTGLRDGKWRYYYDNDVLEFEGYYIQGNPDGKHKYYYPNGNIKEEQYYIQGIKEKHWKKYDENGNVTIVISYKDDNEIRINGVKIELVDNDKILIR